MHRLLIASAFVLAFSGIAAAKQEGIPNPYYVAKHTESGACVIMNTSPNPKFFQVMGTYDSMEAAHTAMGGMKDCAA
ncbi:MAG: hypothetical protein AB7V40_10335 [Methyloceanibacter sp.]